MLPMIELNRIESAVVAALHLRLTWARLTFEELLLLAAEIAATLAAVRLEPVSRGNLKRKGTRKHPN